MKGLFWKEWSILTRSYKQIVLLLVVIYGLLGIAMGQTTMAYALQVVFSIMVTSTIAFDENSHWDAYARTLPVTPSQIVGCKYLFGLGGLAAGSVLAALIVALSNLLDEPILIYHTVDKVGAIDLATALLVCGSLSLLFVGLILPLSYCFNSARARSSIFLVFGAFGLLIGAAVAALPDRTRGTVFAFLNSSPDEVILPWLAVAFAVLLALYGVSYKICVEIYTKKEY